MVTGSAAVPAQAGGFRHETALYDDLDEYVLIARDWIGRGLASGEEVVVVAPAVRAAHIAGDLGTAADRVTFISAEATYRDVGPMFHRFRGFVKDARRAAEGRRLRLLAEHPLIEVGRLIPGELREYVNHESLCNAAFAGDRASFLCLYPRGALSAPDRVRVECAHPVVHRDGRAVESAGYTDSAALIGDGRSEVGSYVTPRSEQVTLTGADDLARARALVRAVGAPLDVAPARLSEFLIAVSEIATNALVHGRGPGLVAAWTEADDRLVCDVRDVGAGPRDPLAGYEPAPTDSYGGRGLWLARQLCTLLEMGCGDAGTVVRLHLARR